MSGWQDFLDRTVAFVSFWRVGVDLGRLQRSSAGKAGVTVAVTNLKMDVASWARVFPLAGRTVGEIQSFFLRTDKRPASAPWISPDWEIWVDGVRVTDLSQVVGAGQVFAFRDP